MTRANPRVQPSAVKVWRLYRFYAADGTLLYIGQTGRMPLERLIEHLYEQGWAHEIARWEVDARIWATGSEVLAAEEAAIRAEKPRYNWQHNDGPHRVWVPKRASYRHPGRRPSATSRLSPAWRRRRDWAIALFTGWLAATLLLWWADAAVTAVDLPGRTYPIAAAGLTALIPVARLRRLRDVKIGVAVVTVACILLWSVTG